MNIHNKNWAQYEYSYNLANSRENWAQKKNSVRYNRTKFAQRSIRAGNVRDLAYEDNCLIVLAFLGCRELLTDPHTTG